MKVNEPYIPSVTSNQIPENILFKLASDDHVDQIVMLMHDGFLPLDFKDEIAFLFQLNI